MLNFRVSGNPNRWETWESHVKYSIIYISTSKKYHIEIYRPDRNDFITTFGYIEVKSMAEAQELCERISSGAVTIDAIENVCSEARKIRKSRKVENAKAAANSFIEEVQKHNIPISDFILLAESFWNLSDEALEIIFSKTFNP